MIPLLPTLNIRQWRTPLPPQENLPFPLRDAATLRYYYFARNGVWEAMETLSLKGGDEVLIPAYTSGIEVEAMEARGIVPVFYALEPDLSPDYSDARSKLSSRTKAFYLIHYFGFPQPLEPVRSFVRAHGLRLFEDNALGFLSSYPDGLPLGSIGDVGLYCPRKTLPLPHGGLLRVNNPAMSMPSAPQRAPSRYSTLGETVSLLLRDASKNDGTIARAADWVKLKAVPFVKQALSPLGLRHTESGGAEFDTHKAGWRMARICKYLLPRFDFATIKKTRRENYILLAELLKDLDDHKLKILFPRLADGVCPLEFMIFVDDLPRMVETLRRYGIECGLHWWWKRPRQIAAPYPELARLFTQGVLLPVHQDVSAADIKKIADTVRESVS